MNRGIVHFKNMKCRPCIPKFFKLINEYNFKVCDKCFGKIGIDTNCGSAYAIASISYEYNGETTTNIEELIASIEKDKSNK